MRQASPKVPVTDRREGNYRKVSVLSRFLRMRLPLRLFRAGKGGDAD